MALGARSTPIITTAMVVAVALGLAPASPAKTLRVGPGQRFTRPCQAIARAHAGDTILIDARVPDDNGAGRGGSRPARSLR